LPGGIAYVVGAAVIVADEDEARAAVTGVFAGTARRRPFHWHEEGPTARRAIIDVLGELGAVAHICVHYPTGRRKLEAARAGALRAVVPKIVRDGASLLLIESRGDLEDRRDRAVILDALNALQRPGELAYQWRDKSESLLWLADGICGAVRQHLLQIDDGPLEVLRATGVVDDLDYISSPSRCVSPGSRPRRHLFAEMSSDWPSGACVFSLAQCQGAVDEFIGRAPLEQQVRGRSRRDPRCRHLTGQR
jgi:hypothetical protein